MTDAPFIAAFDMHKLIARAPDWAKFLCVAGGNHEGARWFWSAEPPTSSLTLGFLVVAGKTARVEGEEPCGVPDTFVSAWELAPLRETCAATKTEFLEGLEAKAGAPVQGRQKDEVYMTQERFTLLVDGMLEQARGLLVVKGGEYTQTEDRLDNFKRGADLTGSHPLQVALIYMSKHYDGIATYVRDQANGTERPRSESIKGRLLDLINYGLLMAALVDEYEARKNG